MIVYALAPPRQGGGTLFVAVADPGVAIEWSLVGPGSLVPLGDRTDAGGVASARYDAGAALAGEAMTVRAEAYP
jgi:hypothetical protein